MTTLESINAKTTIFDLTEAFPTTVEVLVKSGFPKMADPIRRQKQGKALTLEGAAKLRGLDVEGLVSSLRESARATEAESYDVTLGEVPELTLHPPGDVRCVGLLPCPVRIPFLETVVAGAQEIWDEEKLRVGWSLAAASVGADSLIDEIASVKSAEELPEIFISAGFEAFFDQRALRRFKDKDVFVDLAPEETNSTFAKAGLRDPQGHFTMLAVVPAVFVVNHKLLGDIPAPRTWSDLLHPRLEGQVALPVGDFDLFNGMLLTIQKIFGNEGVEALARNTIASLHPSQAVGRFAGRVQKQPAVSVVPYFFSTMTLKSKILELVWPEDGAIVSPIFMLVKKSTVERVRPLVDRLLSKEVGEILAHRGLFPSLHPEVENKLPAADSPFLWLGWEAIEAMDIASAIEEVNAIYRKGAEEALK
ncbi:MAG: ABC transporter substrate-binding protein [Deltaproteobacteria bacterium]|nr:ABC transporter substrate-binding protein [Deltaproteobacteria bacterium]